MGVREKDCFFMLTKPKMFGLKFRLYYRHINCYSYRSAHQMIKSLMKNEGQNKRRGFFAT